MVGPKLRFKKFSGSWRALKLSDTSSYTKGFAFKSKDYTASGKRIIRVSDLTSSSIKKDCEKIYVSEDNLIGLNQYQINKGEVIVTTVGSKPDLRESAVGRAILIKEDGIGYLNQNLLKLEIKPEFNEYFIYTSLIGSRYLNYIESIQRGNANQSNITVGNLFEFPIYAPTIEEQKEIGDFFLAVDQKIALLTQKLELLTTYKKGVMQKMFNQEIRFKDDAGNDYPEWADGQLSDYVEIQGGYAFSSAKFQKGKNKVIKIGDVLPQIRLERFSGSYSEEMPGPKYLVGKDDFLMALSGATFGKVGKVIDEGSAYINQRVATFRTSYIKEFFFQLVQSQDFINYIKSIPTASAQPNNSNADIGRYKCEVPSIHEQQKIASFLSALDEKISNTQKQLDLTKQYKQGLLQQMFI